MGYFGSQISGCYKGATRGSYQITRQNKGVLQNGQISKVSG